MRTQRPPAPWLADHPCWTFPFSSSLRLYSFTDSKQVTLIIDSQSTWGRYLPKGSGSHRLSFILNQRLESVIKKFKSASEFLWIARVLSKVLRIRPIGLWARVSEPGVARFCTSGVNTVPIFYLKRLGDALSRRGGCCSLRSRHVGCYSCSPNPIRKVVGAEKRCVLYVRLLKAISRKCRTYAGSSCFGARDHLRLHSILFSVNSASQTRGSTSHSPRLSMKRETGRLWASCRWLRGRCHYVENPFAPPLAAIL